MIIKIILCLIILVLLYKYINLKPKEQRNEHFTFINDNINDVMPLSSTMKIGNMTEFETNIKNKDDYECARTDNYRHKFFEFNDRINNNSHQNDSVDNINITNKANDYGVGLNISEIYDDLVNTNEYKSGINSLCRNAHNVSDI